MKRFFFVVFVNRKINNNSYEKYKKYFSKKSKVKPSGKERDKEKVEEEYKKRIEKKYMCKYTKKGKNKKPRKVLPFRDNKGCKDNKKKKSKETRHNPVEAMKST